jgi:hypothetical protein
MAEVSQLIADFEQFLRILVIKYSNENPKSGGIDFEERQMLRNSGRHDNFIAEASERARELLKSAPDSYLEILKNEFNQKVKAAASVLRV